MKITIFFSFFPIPFFLYITKMHVRYVVKHTQE